MPARTSLLTRTPQGMPTSSPASLPCAGYARLVERSHQRRFGIVQRCLDQHASHAAASAGDRDPQSFISESHAFHHFAKETPLVGGGMTVLPSVGNEPRSISRLRVSETDRRVSRLRRGDITTTLRQLAVGIEKDRKPARFDLSGTSLLQPIEVIPAVGVKHVHQHRRAENEAHLILESPGRNCETISCVRTLPCCTSIRYSLTIRGTVEQAENVQRAMTAMANRGKIMFWSDGVK
jgi:hypothetical protein